MDGASLHDMTTFWPSQRVYNFCDTLSATIGVFWLGWNGDGWDQSNTWRQRHVVTVAERLQVSKRPMRKRIGA
ncbi:hypothetical protein HYQ45_018783 [Verticillium longisporum]|uniref:Uncharacterized protein n=1 Tax=Verticillium longisporum TaxID=100787 RepID=A0A8I3A1K3_VERLO|nr:hypothetical protein HYQ45_018783 [Verticillium longisporum]